MPESKVKPTATDEQARQAIKKIASTALRPMKMVYATVDSVSEDERTCDVTVESGASGVITDVKLQASTDDGELKVPAVGSTIGILMSNDMDPTVFAWSELAHHWIKVGDSVIDVIDGTIQFGDGSFDGLVKVGELTEKLNALENKFNSLLTTLQGVVIPLAPSGTYPFAPVFAGITALVETQQSEIENEDIIHGTN